MAKKGAMGAKSPGKAAVKTVALSAGSSIKRQTVPSKVKLAASRPAARTPIAPAAKGAASTKAAAVKADANGGKSPAKAASRPQQDDRAAAAQAIPPTPPSNGKPRKNQAGFSARDLEHLRDLLLSKRRELIGDMSSMEREALRSSTGSNLSNLPIHMADMGTDNYEQEFTLGLVQKDRDLLKEINLALAKIQNGTYGICEGTGEPIIKERLEFQPWVRYSVEYQRKMERHGR